MIRGQRQRARLCAAALAMGSVGNGCSGGGGGSQSPPAAPVATHFQVVGPTSTPPGTGFAFTVTALDAANNTVTSYGGTVGFKSSDPHSQLPAAAQLTSGQGKFAATLTTPGNQTITGTDSSAPALTGVSNDISVGSIPGAFAVNSYGAKGDGKSDDTQAIQNAIAGAAAAGGGTVVFSVARYYTTGTLTVPRGVVLSGAIQGPFDVTGVNPAVTTIAPTLLVTNTAAPFITLSGLGAGVTDLLFHYPKQVQSSAAAPNVYPYTIELNGAVAGKVLRSTVTNAFNFLDIQLGRVAAQDLRIGAFNIGIYIDNTQDFVTLHNVHHGVLWDDLEGAQYPRPIDSWVLANGTALIVGRMDALEVHDFHVFSRFTGMRFVDSRNQTLNIRCGWGAGSDITLENVQYGIIAYASEPQGYKFTNLQVSAAQGLGQAAVALLAGGSIAPDIVINGGSVRGSWAQGAFPSPQAGHLSAVNIQ